MTVLAVQFDLFQTESESEIESLRKAFAKTQKSCDNVRKKLFAENGELKKRIAELESRLEIIERNICKGIFNEKKMDRSRDLFSYSRAEIEEPIERKKRSRKKQT